MTKQVTNFALVLVGLQVFSTPIRGSNAEHLLIEGKRSFKDKKYDIAEQLLRELVDKDPNNQEAHYFLGYTLDRKGNRDGSKIPDLDWESTDQISREFEKVIELNPSYKGEIIILYPTQKIMTEWASLALRFLYDGNVGKAKAALNEAKKRGGAVTTLLEYARNTLTSCPHNSILFTNGDVDTFYPYYVQIVEGYRTDITIINLSLLNTRWYNDFLNQKKAWQKQALNGVSMKLFEEVLHQAFDPFTSTIPKYGCNEPNSMIEVAISPAIKIDTKHIMRKQDFMLLHILKNNRDRPICAAITVSKESIPQINGETFTSESPFELMGLVYRISFCKKTPYNWAKMHEDIIMHKLSYKEISKLTTLNRWQKKMMSNYIACFIQPAIVYEKSNHKDQARSLLKSFVEMIPAVYHIENAKMRDYILNAAGVNAK